MNDVLKRLLLAWLIHFSWISVAKAACDPSLQSVTSIPEKPTEGVPVVINMGFEASKAHPVMDVSYELSENSISIHIVRISACGLTANFPAKPFSIKTNIGILPEGEYSVDVFYRNGTLSEEVISSTSLSVLARAEISSIPSLSENGSIILTLLLFLVMAAHRYNFINFTKKLKDS